MFFVILFYDVRSCYGWRIFLASAMSEEPALPERILDAAEAVLRRHGTEKANVVDIARSLDMSHGNIYRHFFIERNCEP